MSSVMEFASSRLQVLMGQVDEGTKELVAMRRAKEAAKYAPHAKYTNWSQIGSCKPQLHVVPTTVEEVLTTVRQAASTGTPIRAAGGLGHSYNGCNYTSGVMIHTNRLNRILRVDNATMRITVEAGATYREICAALDSQQLQIRAVPSILDISIGGALATAAHGTGLNTPSISGLVRAMTFVNGKGELVTLTAENNKEELRVAACHLGLLGIVVAVELQAERKKEYRMHSKPISCGEVTRLIAQRVMMNDFYRFWWTPHTDMCYESTANSVQPTDEEGAPSTAGRSIRTAATTASATNPRAKLQAINRVLKPVRGGAADEAEAGRLVAQRGPNPVVRAFKNCAQKPLFKHRVVESALYAGTFVPQIQPLINKAYRGVYLSDETITFGTAADVMTFDCLFKQTGNEWAIEAHRAIDALEAVRQIVHSENLRVHFPVEFRFADSDGAAMSPGGDRKTCWVGIVMFRPYGRDAPDAIKFNAAFCQAMERLGGRPHWAKSSPWRHRDFQKAYGSNLAAFAKLRAKHDPKKLFRNDWATCLDA